MRPMRVRGPCLAPLCEITSLKKYKKYQKYKEYKEYKKYKKYIHGIRNKKPRLFYTLYKSNAKVYQHGGKTPCTTYTYSP